MLQDGKGGFRGFTDAVLQVGSLRVFIQESGDITVSGTNGVLDLFFGNDSVLQYAVTVHTDRAFMAAHGNDELRTAAHDFQHVTDNCFKVTFRREEEQITEQEESNITDSETVIIPDNYQVDTDELPF